MQNSEDIYQRGGPFIKRNWCLLLIHLCTVNIADICMRAAPWSILINLMSRPGGVSEVSSDIWFIQLCGATARLVRNHLYVRDHVIHSLSCHIDLNRSYFPTTEPSNQCQCEKLLPSAFKSSFPARKSFWNPNHLMCCWLILYDFKHVTINLLKLLKLSCVCIKLILTGKTEFGSAQCWQSFCSNQ